MPVNGFEQLAPVLMTYLLHSTVVMGGVWLWSRTVRISSARFRQAAWKFSMLLALATAPLQAWLQVEPWAGRWSLPGLGAGLNDPTDAGENAHLDRTYNANTSAIIAAAVPAERGNGSEQLASGAMEPATELLHVQPQAASSVAVSGVGYHKVARWLAVLWLTGAAVGAVRLTVHWRRLRSGLGLQEIKSGPARTLLDRLAVQAGVRCRVRLYRASAASSPVAWGVWSGKIAIPRTLLRQLNEREMTALLAHELGHWARGDTRWLWVAGAVSAAGFFQPLNRVARRRIRAESELLCDSWAVSQTGDRLGLARCLTAVAEALQAGLARPELAAAAVSGRTLLAERVGRLLEDRPLEPSCCGDFARRLVLAGGLLLAAVAIVLLPGFRPGAEPRSDIAAAAQPAADASPLEAASLTSAVSPNSPVTEIERELNLLQSSIDELTATLARLPLDPQFTDRVQRVEQRLHAARLRHQQLREFLRAAEIESSGLE